MEAFSMTDNEIRAIGYKGLTAEHIFSYLESLNDEKAIADFISNSDAYEYYKSVPIIGEDGKPVFTASRISKKTGKPTTPRIKHQLVKLDSEKDKKEIEALKKKAEDSKKTFERRFNVLKAKKYFCKTYFPDMFPTSKEKKQKKSTPFFDKYKDLL